MDISSSIMIKEGTSDFVLLSEQEVGYLNLCTEMQLHLETEDQLLSVFTHASTGSIVLQELKVE